MVKQILKEANTYDYGCVMLYFNFPEINKIHNSIKPEHLYEEESDRSYGIEDEPHCTLLYGLHNGVGLNEVKQLLNDIQFGQCKVGNASLFQNPKYDVLKFDVSGKGLHEANKALTTLPYSTDYPDYHPHLTIAYLKPGMGNGYVKAIGDRTYGLQPAYAVYSEANGTKTKFKIKK